MHTVELERSLRQPGLDGMTAVLKTRLRQAQVEVMAAIDLIACLVLDELTRTDRLLERRRKQAAFRYPDKTLDNFNFNPKMNRTLMFDLASGAFIAKRRRALSRARRHGQNPSGPEYPASRILQGYKALYRKCTSL